MGVDVGLVFNYIQGRRATPKCGWAFLTQGLDQPKSQGGSSRALRRNLGRPCSTIFSFILLPQGQLLPPKLERKTAGCGELQLNWEEGREQMKPLEAAAPVRKTYTVNDELLGAQCRWLGVNCSRGPSHRESPTLFWVLPLLALLTFHSNSEEKSPHTYIRIGGK